MDDGAIGRRLRELRAWRGLSLRATAELAGFSPTYLSLIERGLRPVDKRSTLEAFATALRVAPSELGSAFPPSSRPDDEHVAARLHVPDVEEAVTDIEIGENGGRTGATWPEITARSRRQGRRQITAPSASCTSTNQTRRRASACSHPSHA